MGFQDQWVILAVLSGFFGVGMTALVICDWVQTRSKSKAGSYTTNYEEEIEEKKAA